MVVRISGHNQGAFPFSVGERLIEQGDKFILKLDARELEHLPLRQRQGIERLVTESNADVRLTATIEVPGGTTVFFNDGAPIVAKVTKGGRVSKFAKWL